jgi:hypothetical protein
MSSRLGLPSATCWDREFADCLLEESGFEPLVPLNLRRRRFSEYLSGLPRAAQRLKTDPRRTVCAVTNHSKRLFVDAAQRRHRYLLDNRHRSRLGVSGTSGSNPLSSREESAEFTFIASEKLPR